MLFQNGTSFTDEALPSFNPLIWPKMWCTDPGETRLELSWGRFHQRSTYSFYARRSRKCKKIQLSRQYLFMLSGPTSVKSVSRTLMKLTPGETRLEVKFINILQSAFLHADPQSAKRHWYLDCLFALLGSGLVKAVHKMLVKSTFNFDA